MPEGYPDDYTLFPREGLLALAEHFEGIGRAWSVKSEVGARLRDEHQKRAEVCRSAVKSFDALLMLVQSQPHANGKVVEHAEDAEGAE